MNRHLVACAAAVLALNVAEKAACDVPMTPAVSTKTGVVRQVNPVVGSIVVMVANELTFYVTSTTQIRQEDAARTLADIRTGDTVTVEYAFDDQHARMASRIVVGAPAAAPQAPPPSAAAGAAEPGGVRAATGTVARAISVNYQNAPLQDVCADLTKKAGVPVTCIGIFAQKQVTYAAENVEVRAALDAIAASIGSRIYDRDGGFRFRRPD